MRRPWASVALAAALVACSDAASSSGAGVLDGASDASTSDAPGADVIASEVASDAALGDGGVDAIDAPTGLDGGTYLFELDAAPFPATGHPDVAVHVPPGFQPSASVGCVVFFHGFDNCVANVVGSTDGVCPPNTTVRSALHLADQLDAAKVNALLVAVQLRYDQSTGDPGALVNKGQLHALLHELLTEHLDAVLGRSLDVADLSRVVIASHSGGYEAAAMAITVGGLTGQITEVDLHDSLYGYLSTYDTWVSGEIARFDPARADRLRFATEYTSGGGTAANARAMAAAAEGWTGDAGLEASVLFDDTTDTLSDAQYGRPLIFKLSGLTHNDVPRYYFEKLVASAGFAPLP